MKDRQTKIVLIVSSLRCGGTERVAATLANYWAEHGREIELMTLNAPEEQPFFTLHPDVHLVSLNLTAPSSSLISGLLASLRRVWRIRQHLQRIDADIVIGFGERMNIYAILACLGRTKTLIISEHAVPYAYNPGRIYRILRSCLYRFAGRLVVVSQDLASRFTGIMTTTPIVIPNPLSKEATPLLHAPTDRNSAHFSIVAVGRLVADKGFDLLIQAFSIVQQRFPNVLLTIWGEGERRSELEKQLEKLSLDKVVRLPGNNKSVSEIYGSADLFVLSSRAESLGNVILEAMAMGVPVVSFDCPSGPREIITQGSNGILVPAEDVAALAAAMINLISNAELRQSLSVCAKETAQRYRLEAISPLWDAVMGQLLQKAA